MLAEVVAAAAATAPIALRCGSCGTSCSGGTAPMLVDAVCSRGDVGGGGGGGVSQRVATSRGCLFTSEKESSNYFCCILEVAR